MEGPGQPFAVGVIVKVTVIGAFVVFVNEPKILPGPLAGRPNTEIALSLVQVNDVPLTLLLRTIVVMDDPEQIICEEGVAITLGVGFTSIVAIMGTPSQPLAVGVIVKVTVTGLVVVLVNTPLILPVPPVLIPETATPLFLVQL